MVLGIIERVSMRETKVITNNFLFQIRRRALRKKIWMKVLDRDERSILSLTTRLVERVKSNTLRYVLEKIVDKLMDAMKSEFVRIVETTGLDMSKKLSKKALEWGYNAAGQWANDMGFAMYLVKNFRYNQTGPM